MRTHSLNKGKEPERDAKRPLANRSMGALLQQIE